VTERPMPHNLEAERAVLGAVLVDNEAFAAADGIITEETFFRKAHGQIWQALAALLQRDKPADLITVTNELARLGTLEEVGGPAYVASLVDGVPRSTNVPHYAGIVKEKAALRALILTARRIEDAAHEGEPVDHLAATAVADIETTRQRLAGSQGNALAGRFRTAREACRERTAPPMLLEPYIVEGTILSFVGKIKDGKTSSLLEMVRCLRRQRGYCGFAPPKTDARVLLASEQTEASLSNQLADAGLQQDDGLIVSYLADWHGQPWSVVGPALVRYAIDHSIRAIGVDTASRWFGFRGDEENHSGGAEHVDVFLPFCATGGAVILSRHARKSGGAVSDAARGSSAIEGAADVILHITKPTGHGPDVRQMEAVGRFDMPDRLLVRRKLRHFDNPSVGDVVVVEPRYVFERIDDSADDGPAASIRASLKRGAKTIQSLAEDTGIPEHTVDRTIKEMADAVKVGKGGPRNNAAIWGLKATTTTPQSLRGVNVEVGIFDERY
jgi:DnaB-like helicase N terminal domain/AAA domain